MNRLIFLLSIISISLIVQAATPVEIEIDGITYRLDSEKMTALVFDVIENIETASVLDQISYNDQVYNVTSIGKDAFSWCTHLKSVELPNTITSINQMAFRFCFSLESITIPNSLNSIGDFAFYGCYNLTSIHISDLSSWFKINFNGPNSCNPLSVAGGDLYFNDSVIENLIIPNDIELIQFGLFSRCRSIREVTAFNSVKTLASYAFEYCPNLEIVNLGLCIESIEDYSFGNCPMLRTINVYNNIPPHASGAFKFSYPEYMTLHIPQGTIEVYEKAEGWKDFGTIIDDLPNESGIDNISLDYASPIEIYNTNGVCIFYGIGNYKLSPGLYIIKQGSKSKKMAQAEITVHGFSGKC